MKMGGKPLGPPISSGNCFTGRYSPTYRWASAFFICLIIVWFFNLSAFLLIFNLHSSRLSMPKNLREKKLGTNVPFLYSASFVIVWSMCDTNFLCVDDIYKKSKYGSYMIFFQGTRPTYEKVYDKSAGE